MPKRVRVQAPTGLGAAVSFGVRELEQALTRRGDGTAAGGPATITIHPPVSGGRAESYTVQRSPQGNLTVTGGDDNGLLYGCLDLAEQLAMGANPETVATRDVVPELAVRGIYLFLHNEEAERDWVNDPAFWQHYADSLARDRYNRFNLIYGHQSPYLIPIYAFLLDTLDEEFPDIRVQGITPQERTSHLRVLQMASEAMASRGLTFFLGIWNSRPWQTANGVWETQPTRVTGTDDLGRLVAYTRRGFSDLLARCPHVGGIQLRMNIESGIGDQRFFVQAFVPALQEVADSGRRLTVELRNWGLHPDTIEAFRGVGLPIVVSTKYFAEHQGLPYQPPVMRGSYSYDSFLRKDKPFPFQWHVWNLGSHRLFAWGDPDYARRLALSCHLGDGVGFEVTPPQSQKGFSQWGAVHPGDWHDRADLPVRWAHERYWFFHSAFGRLGYDPTTPEAVFLHQLALRTTEEAAPAMLQAYRLASQVVSYLISMRMDDPNMYVWPELDAGGPIDHHAIAPPGEGTLFATAREHAEDRLARRRSAKVTPFGAAEDLDGYADAIEASLQALEALPGLGDKVEYQTVRVDWSALAALARYHAAKARAAGNLALFYVSGDRYDLDRAERHADEATVRWEELCRRTGVYYERLHLGPTGGHWRDNLPRVRYDRQRLARVREILDDLGLFAWGFDCGPSWPHRFPPRAWSGLEPEPRFTNVPEETAYSPERGYGWLGTGGLRAVGMSPLGRDLLWGTHPIVPGGSYDPKTVRRMPLDGLTQSYLTGELPRTFRVDLADGDYEVTLIAPAVMGATTEALVNARAVTLGQGSAPSVRVTVHVSGGALEVTLGRERPWALAGLTVRPLAPVMGHLPALVVDGDCDFVLSATATSATGRRTVRVRYRCGGEWRTMAMDGDGVAFQATLPADHLLGDALEYELEAQDEEGRDARARYRVPVRHGFQTPRIVAAEGPQTWATGEQLRFRATLEAGEHAEELRLHYREADQNREFRVAAVAAGRSGGYEVVVDSGALDDAYELIHYWEVLDTLGGGSFYPDPFTEARYRVVRPR